jgi:hypothetical protein
MTPATAKYHFTINPGFVSRMELFYHNVCHPDAFVGIVFFVIGIQEHTQVNTELVPIVM